MEAGGKVIIRCPLQAGPSHTGAHTVGTRLLKKPPMAPGGIGHASAPHELTRFVHESLLKARQQESHKGCRHSTYGHAGCNERWGQGTVVVVAPDHRENRHHHAPQPLNAQGTPQAQCQPANTYLFFSLLRQPTHMSTMLQTLLSPTRPTWALDAARHLTIISALSPSNPHEGPPLTCCGPRTCCSSIDCCCCNRALAPQQPLWNVVPSLQTALLSTCTPAVEIRRQLAQGSGSCWAGLVHQL